MDAKNLLQLLYSYSFPPRTAKIVTFFDIPPAADEIPLFVQAFQVFGQQIARSIY